MILIVLILSVSLILKSLEENVVYFQSPSEIKNFAELKSDLQGKGVSFNSQTDTEVVARLVEEKISKDNCEPLEAVRIVARQLSGSFALCFIFKSGFIWVDILRFIEKLGFTLSTCIAFSF